MTQQEFNGILKAALNGWASTTDTFSVVTQENQVLLVEDGTVVATASGYVPYHYEDQFVEQADVGPALPHP